MEAAFDFKEMQGREERLAPGHRMCAGCGATIAVRNVLKALHPVAFPTTALSSG